MAENSAVEEARKLVADIEAVAVPAEHRYAGMVQTKLDEAKTWASKMVEELSGGEVSADEAENQGQDTGEKSGEGDGTDTSEKGDDTDTGEDKE